MMRYFLKTVSIPIFAIIFLFNVSSVFAQEASEPVSPKADKEQKAVSTKRDSPIKTIFDQTAAEVEAVADSLEYQKDSDKLVARGNAVFTYRNMRLLADYAELETKTKQAYAKGHVLIFQDDTPLMKGDEAFFNFENRTGSFPGGRTYTPPFFGHGKEIKQVKEGEIKVKDGGVTTCNLENPHYEIRCKKATLYSGVKIRMYSATIYVLGKPVFWLPYLVLPLNWNVPLQATAGYRSEYGPYLLLTKGITFNKYLSGKLHADWRQKRGFGGGYDQDYSYKQYAQGDIKLYWTQDDRAPTPGAANSDGVSNPYANREKRDRGRITWRHRTDINDYTNIILRYHRVADEYFLHDFMEDEYRAQMEPHSFITATHNSQRYGAMIHVEKRMNKFEGIVERLPEVRLDWKNQPLPLPEGKFFENDFIKDRIYNVSRLQFDNLYKRFSRSDNDQSAFRVDGYSRFIYPIKYKEIKLTPYLGYRGTEYSRQLISNSGKFRQTFEYGADLRTQVYKTYDVNFDKAGIEVNQLRHIFEPSVVLQGEETSVPRWRFTHFDSIDTVDDSSEVVFGLENKLQTKRVIRGKTQRVDFVSVNTYVHYAFKPIDRTLSGGGFTLLENEITLRPYDWMQLQQRLEVDLARHYIKRLNNDIVLRKGRFRFIFGQRYVHDQYDYDQDLTIPESMQFVTDAQFKINDLWSVGGYFRWDTHDGSLQEWQVSATRDLHDFILDFGYNVRDSLINSHNKSLFFMFRMKAFPQFGLGAGGGVGMFSEPRIGDTVAGSNTNRGRYSISRERQFFGFN